MIKKQLPNFELLSKRQRAIRDIAVILSDTDNLRGESYKVIDCMAPYSNSSSVHIYVFDEKAYYRGDTTCYKAVSSWFKSGDELNEESLVSIYKSTLPKDAYRYTALRIENLGVEKEYFLPLMQNDINRDILFYPLLANSDVVGFLVLVSVEKDGWSQLCEEWLESISAMISASIRRTISNDALAKELKLRDNIYPIIAHDLRSSIGSLKMMTEAIDHQDMTKEDREYMNHMIRRGAEEAFMLLDNLLKWSRSNMQALEVDKSMTHIKMLVDSVLELFIPVATAKSITLETNVELEYDAEFFCDSEMIKTVMRNILSNAIKFSYENSVVKIKSIIDDKGFYFEVEDFGAGMSAEDIDRLNNNSEYFSTYGTNNEKGCGLGYVLCRKFVDLHNGTINIKSTLREGSRFKIFCPLDMGDDVNK